MTTIDRLMDWLGAGYHSLWALGIIIALWLTAWATGSLPWIGAQIGKIVDKLTGAKP